MRLHAPKLQKKASRVAAGDFDCIAPSGAVFGMPGNANCTNERRIMRLWGEKSVKTPIGKVFGRKNTSTFECAFLCNMQ